MKLETTIKKNKERNEHMFIFAARRGLSPMTVCGDCATTVFAAAAARRSFCTAVPKENFFSVIAAASGEAPKNAAESVAVGNSRLSVLALNLFRKSLTGMFPDVKIFRMDKDTSRLTSRPWHLWLPVLQCSRQYFAWHRNGIALS
jgi:hypothetical protein